MYATDEKGNIVLTMTRDEYSLLLLQLGYALGALSKENSLPRELMNQALKLVNSLNEGNPNWKPYELMEEPT